MERCFATKVNILPFPGLLDRKIEFTFGKAQVQEHALVGCEMGGLIWCPDLLIESAEPWNREVSRTPGDRRRVAFGRAFSKESNPKYPDEVVLVEVGRKG